MDQAALATLLPHAGAMVLLDAVEHWDAEAILCRAGSHLAPANPLRRDGRLAALAGVEYGCQAAALHGALLAGGQRQAGGYLASLRNVALHVARLDDPGFGRLRVMARLERQEAGGMVYSFAIATACSRPLLDGRAAIALARA